MSSRIAVTLSALGILLGASQTALAQGQPDPCADAFFAWAYTQCTSQQAIDGRRARGIPEPAHPEDPMIIRARRNGHSATARAETPSRALDQVQESRAATTIARPE